jgi:hypothetical protein
VKRIKSIILEDSSSSKERERNPPATNTGENEEVRMLEDVPIRSRSEVSGEREPDMERGGKAKIELNGHELKGEENRPEDKSTKKAGNQGQQQEQEKEKEKDRREDEAKKKAGRQGQQPEQDEERDRREGKAGKTSGREGEARGGERSRSRQK